MLIFVLFCFRRPSIQFGSYLKLSLTCGCWLHISSVFKGFNVLFESVLYIEHSGIFWNLGSNLNCSSVNISFAVQLFVCPADGQFRCEHLCGFIHRIKEFPYPAHPFLIFLSYSLFCRVSFSC